MRVCVQLPAPKIWGNALVEATLAALWEIAPAEMEART